jgi:hypothetical protein
VRIYLQFQSSQTREHRARLGYAFRLFCAIYGHQPLLTPEEANSADIWITYWEDEHQLGTRPTLQLSNGYTPRLASVPAPAPWPFRCGDEDTVLVHAPKSGSEPDWFGEIFEWVSCADEYSVRKRDMFGRIPFAESYVARHKLRVDIPYAAVAMRLLQKALCRLVPNALLQPVCPIPSTSHFVVNTHDVDYLPVGYFSSLHRLGKNAAISLLIRHRPGLAAKQARWAMGMALGGHNPLDQLPILMSLEARRRVGTSYFFLVVQYHRRDGNYDVSDPVVLGLMRLLEEHGMEVGVHGSYTSLDEPSRLASEFDVLRRHGFRPAGGRQHWLRFTLERVIPALEKAGASYDASLGWSETAGFRAGACFAFPPYSFEREQPANFLEIPLIIMDAVLPVGVNGLAESYNKAMQILSISQRYGWGGISLLWHPTAFGGGQYPEELGETFWRLLDHSVHSGERWVSAAGFVRAVAQRYVECGLLPA